MELGHRSSFRMIAQLRFSGRLGDARLDARVRRVGVCRACRANGPGRPGAGQGGPGGPGRARLGAIIRIVQIIGFLDQLLKIQPGSKLLVKLGPREENPKLLLFLENAPYCPIIFGPKKTNNIAKIPIIQLPNYWSIIGPNYW